MSFSRYRSALLASIAMLVVALVLMVGPRILGVASDAVGDPYLRMLAIVADVMLGTTYIGIALILLRLYWEERRRMTVGWLVYGVGGLILCSGLAYALDAAALGASPYGGPSWPLGVFKGMAATAALLTWAVLPHGVRALRRLYDARDLADQQGKELLELYTDTHAKYRLLTDNALDLMSILDDHGRYLYASPSHLRILGLHPRYLLGMDRLLFVHPDDRALLRAVLTSGRHAASGTYLTPIRFRTRGKQASYIWVEHAARALTIGGKRRFVVICRNINDQVAAERALLDAYDQTLDGWVKALDLRDHETEGHSQRVTKLATRLAQRFGFVGVKLTAFRRGALLHDIGKIGVPDAILHKPGPLTADEWTLMRKHPVFARDLLQPIAYLRESMLIPWLHHERWDGSGYPSGMRGESIPLEARIFAVADTYDALTSPRPYKPSRTHRDAMTVIRSESGKAFDPKVVREFSSLLGDTGSELPPDPQRQGEGETHHDDPAEPRRPRRTY